jgi:type I restriction enzyme S subunit
MTLPLISKLGDEIELVYGKSLPANERQTGLVPVFGSNGKIGSHTHSLVAGPGIIIGRKGSVGEVVYSDAAFWPIDTTYYVENKKAHDWRFLCHLLSAVGLSELNSHSAVPGLNREDVYSISVRMPPKHEQHDIALALDAIQRSQDLERRAIAETLTLKRAVMRALFTRGLRREAQKETEIGLIPESWDVVSLGSLGRIGNGSTPKKSVHAYWEGGGFPWLTSAKVYDREILVADHFVTQVALRDCHLPIIDPGAILIAITGQGKTLGHCAVLRMRATVNQHIAYVSINPKRADPSFIRGYLETQYDFFRQVGAGGGSTKGALTCAFLRSVPIPFPPGLDEQREIAAVLDAIDHKIDMHRRKRASLDDLFKVLLHKLITGEILVDQLDLSALSSALSKEVAA